MEIRGCFKFAGDQLAINRCDFIECEDAFGWGMLSKKEVILKNLGTSVEKVSI